LASLRIWEERRRNLVSFDLVSSWYSSFLITGSSYLMGNKEVVSLVKRSSWISVLCSSTPTLYNVDSSAITPRLSNMDTSSSFNYCIPTLTSVWGSPSEDSLSEGRRSFLSFFFFSFSFLFFFFLWSFFYFLSFLSDFLLII
jgi:hypothetical protein